MWHWWLCKQSMWQRERAVSMPSKNKWKDLQGASSDSLLSNFVSVSVWSWEWTHPCQHPCALWLWWAYFPRLLLEGICSVLPASGIFHIIYFKCRLIDSHHRLWFVRFLELSGFDDRRVLDVNSMFHKADFQFLPQVFVQLIFQEKFSPGLTRGVCEVWITDFNKVFL